MPFSLSKLVSFVIMASILSFHISKGNWNDPSKVIANDVKGYYTYLPAYFIQNDPDFKKPNDFAYDIWFSTDEEGRNYIKYTSGMAIAYSPFFFVGHAIAAISGYPTNGCSAPYLIALLVGSLLFIMLGIVSLRAILLRYFSDFTVAITLTILFAGTNLWYYSTYEPLMSHAYSFGLIAFFLLKVIQWLEAQRIKHLLLAGVSAGLFVLIRPIDLLFVVLVPLIGVRSMKDLGAQFKLLFEHWQHLLVFALTATVVFIPQFLYNYSIFGSIFHYSYSNEGFIFSDPELFNILFSYRNGWLIYSPVMLFSLIGLIFLFRERKGMTLFVGSSFIIYLFVISSWWCWWYSGFGNRAFINLYPIIGIALAVFISNLVKWKLVIRGSVLILISAFISLNIFQSVQFSEGLIHWESMTKASYWNNFLQQRASQLYYWNLRKPDHEAAIKGQNVVTSPKEKEVFKLDKSIYISSKEMFDFHDTLSLSGSNRFYLKAWIKNAEDLTIVMDAKEKGYFASEEVLEKNGEVSLYHLHGYYPGQQIDTVQFYIWNRAGNEITLERILLSGQDVHFEKVRQ